MPQKDIKLILYRLGQQDRKLDAIHQQSVKTNQRVSKLERWQSFIQGGLAILALLVVPILIYVVTVVGPGPDPLGHCASDVVAPGASMGATH